MSWFCGSNLLIKALTAITKLPLSLLCAQGELTDKIPWSISGILQSFLPPSVETKRPLVKKIILILSLTKLVSFFAKKNKLVSFFVLIICFMCY